MAGKPGGPLNPGPLRTQAFMSQLGTDPASQGGFFAPKPLFWERPTFVIWCAPVPLPHACAAGSALCA